MTESAQAGHFYAVGVGPGAPDLLTLRAARIIAAADVILAPQSHNADRSLALQAIAPLLGNQEILVSSYPMTRDQGKTRDHWSALAADLAERCRRGRAVAQVTLGDPLIFATTSYLLAVLAEKLPADRIHVIPGISAFQLAASCFRQPLTLQEDRLMIMTATDLAAVEQALGQCETLVLYKAGNNLPGLLDLLGKHGLLARARLVSSGGQGEHELRVADLSHRQPAAPGYMTTIIIRIDQRRWQEAPAP